MSFEISPVRLEHGWLTQRFCATGPTAHWERAGLKGSYGVEVKAFGGNAQALQIDTTERGSKSEKRTWITLPKEQAEALRDFLNMAYPCKPGGTT